MKTCPQKACTVIFIGVLSRQTKLGTVQMCTKGRNEQTVGHLNNGVLLSDKQDELVYVQNG